MTHKERVLTAVAHREPDRVPIQVYLTPEIAKRLLDHFGFDQMDQLFRIFGVDLRGVNAPYVGEKAPCPDHSAFVDEWGVGYEMFDHGHGGSYPEPNHLALAQITTMDGYEAYPWPSPDDYDYSNIEAGCDAFGEFAITTGGAGIPDIVNGVGRGRGMQQVIMDIMTGDPVGVAIIDKRCDHYYEVVRRTLEAAKGKIDILCLGEDTGNQNGAMFPPEVFNEFFFPRIKRFIDLGREFGCKTMMHSCGDTHELQPTFIEMGLDILDAMQPEPDGMDPEQIKREHGDKLTLCGLISTQETLPFGTEEQCRAEARHRIEVIGQGGGYIFAPAHCIQANNPLENVLAIYEEALGLEPGALADGKAAAAKLA
jgi:uroporphyrinogen decarboxylase